MPNVLYTNMCEREGGRQGGKMVGRERRRGGEKEKEGRGRDSARAHARGGREVGRFWALTKLLPETQVIHPKC